MAELTRLHPLEQITAELVSHNNDAVTIAAEPFVAMVDVRLPTDVSGTEVLGTEVSGAELLGTRLPTTPNTWVASAAERAIWLGPDEWLLTSTAHAPEELSGRAREALRPLGGVVTDVSAQRIGIRLTGRRARDVLAKGCSIDLHPVVFGQGRAAQTSVGLAGVILLAMSDAGEEFLLLVRSSFAGYLADWLLDAAQEFSTQKFSTQKFSDPISDQE